jgi:hypothetical protein
MLNETEKSQSLLDLLFVCEYFLLMFVGLMVGFCIGIVYTGGVI